ncbi:uncharacterized protein [Engystomops pustulosus]
MRAGRTCSDHTNTEQMIWEIKQAESWVQYKLQALTDGGAACPPTTIQRDIQGFESTVMNLIQMVDQSCRTRAPGTSAVRSQLQALRDQWQLLTHMATHQKCPGGGATTLEFNKKADELEMWMREKEEIPPLHVLLDQNLDKVHITRKILDLKQEQIHYCNLQEIINSLAQKLEKHGGPESRAASTRRKHLNRMWLRLQTPLHEHQQGLQLALEGAALWHQADSILKAMEEKSASVGVRSGDDVRGDQDLREIAGQIMMLDVSVSQVSNLHPLLSSRAQHRQRQVKERWAQLQHTRRTGKAIRSPPTGAPPREDPLTTEEKSSVGNQVQRLLGHGDPGAQVEKTNGTAQRQSRSHVTGGRQRGTPKSVTSDPSTNHSPQSSHEPHGPPETPEVRRLLQEISSTSQWLQAVELLLSEPAAMKSPELIRKELKQVSMLEKELRSRGSCIQGIRGKARKSRRREWTVSEETEAKVQEVEERCQTLQDALQRRVSDLRDTLVLSEFMKVVQMEEERKKEKSQVTTQGAAPDPPDIQAAGRSETFTPLEELQEAVEMLNDAVKEREQALAASRENTELHSRVSALWQMMEAARANLQDIRSQLEVTQEEIVAVKKETELRDLREVSRQQQQVEKDMSKTIGPEVRRLQERREKLQHLCPAQSSSMEDALTTWTDIQNLMEQNQEKLQRTQQLREFFHRYLGMISWTEVTRGRILSCSPRGRLSARQREDLERTMEQKLKEFESLAGIGWRLIGEDHLLAQTIRERLEEVQGLLSWLLMRWRCQKRQRIMGNPAQEKSEAADHTDVTTDAARTPLSSAAVDEFECPEDEEAAPPPAPRGPTLRRYRRRALSPILFQPPSCRPPDIEEGVPESGPRKCGRGPLWLEPKNLPTGSASPEPKEEAVIMVSSYLGIMEEAQNRYDSQSAPPVSKSAPPVSKSAPPVSKSAPPVSKSAPPVSKTTSTSGHNNPPAQCESSSGPLPKIRSSMFFKSLRRKEKAQSVTIQGIMGLYRTPTKDTPRYETSTWPPKQEKALPTLGTNIELDTFLSYVKNPLSGDIDAECGSGPKKLEPKNPVPTSCPRLTIGSILTLQISKDPPIMDNVHDTMTVMSVDDSGNPHHVFPEEDPKPKPKVTEEITQPPTVTGNGQWSCTKTWLDALASSPGYCRQNIHGYGNSKEYSQDSQDLEDLIENFEIDKLSPIILQHPDWNIQDETLTSHGSFEASSPICDISTTTCDNEGSTTLSPVLHKTHEKTTLSSVHGETDEGATIISPVLHKTHKKTTLSSVHGETDEGATIISTVLHKTHEKTTLSSVHGETDEGATIISPVLHKTHKKTTLSSVHGQTDEGAAIISPVLHETHEKTTLSSVHGETDEGATIIPPVLHETHEKTTLSSVHGQTDEGATIKPPVLHEKTTLSSVHGETDEGATITSPVLHETHKKTTLSSVHGQTDEGATIKPPVLHEKTTLSSVHGQTDEGATIISPVLHETHKKTTLSSVHGQTDEGVTIIPPVLHEKTTLSSVHGQTDEGATIIPPVLHETHEKTTLSSVHGETDEGATIIPPVLHETHEKTTLSSVHGETEKGAFLSSPVFREMEEDDTTLFSVRRGTKGGAITSLHFQETDIGATTLSPVLQESRAYCVTQRPGAGQPTSTSSSNRFLHTYGPSHHLRDHLNTTDTSPAKRICTKASSAPEVLHPDHEFLENDDEELEGIWNNAKKVPQVCPPQITYNMAPKAMVASGIPSLKKDWCREAGGRVVMGAEKNMLVATFTLPASAMLSTGLETDNRPKTWKNSQSSVLDLEENCRASPKTPPPQTGERAATSKVTRKRDFLLMEGLLEKKHVLQAGGRKASGRTWGTFYAVLVRRTLCFYHDHKLSTKSPASAPPLHLTGAVCTPEWDYTKRDNCFRLRLLDGAEYLFRAPNSKSLQQWVTKLQHNSGIEDSDLLRYAASASDLSPRITSRTLMPDICQSAPAQATAMVPVADSPHLEKAENVAVAPKLTSHPPVPKRFLVTDGGMTDGDPSNPPTSRRRSQSFSSVMYQKMTSVSGPQDPSSNYSMTIYIADPLIPRGRCHSIAAPQGELLSRHTMDLKPRNKSVFRKFFRNKE